MFLMASQPMSKKIKMYGMKLLIPVLVVCVCALSALAMTIGRAPGAKTREIVMVTRDVAFEVPGQLGANPTLQLKKGQPVRLILRNDEPEKILHCFTIGGLGVKTTKDLATGESETLVFTPLERGTFTYACLMHPMMAGKIVVE